MTAALDLVRADGTLPRFATARSPVVVAQPQVPLMEPVAVNPASYDELLVAAGGARDLSPAHRSNRTVPRKS